MPIEKKIVNKKNSDATSVEKPKQQILTQGGKDAHWRGGAQDYDTEKARDAARKDNQAHES
ncbi:MAG: hypothetical protein Q8K74_11175 [Candidatus Nitrotoga sp.]|nr:hypothetical protein [Candidatus Nitrotoga sp.]MDO9447379.1 hypothetical protein [Candidatus Nitrotoga sp.]MDP1638970.1 hypothetical protein [Candidatus Nitrotoga sp.]MDP1856580.1 hypothetical protein [Candidatus Nitrotoga sp.]